MTAGNASASAATWPADVIHVNEDGWVLLNRGRRHGITAGLDVLVVGQSVRELRNLFASEDANAGQQDLPVVLRTRRTYELLEIVHVEDASSIAIAKRTPAERRPQFYLGPEGETLVWVPLPADFTQAHDDDHEIEGSASASSQVFDDNSQSDGDGAESGAPTDEPPEQEEQEDELWEQALPLNSVNVGDLVVPAVPFSSVAPSVSASMSTGTASSPASPAA